MKRFINQDHWMVVGFKGVSSLTVIAEVGFVAFFFGAFLVAVLI